MIYNFNLGIGWASSGVEYAQAYRANIFRRLGMEARFVFTDMFGQENIEHMTRNIGFMDSEVIWLYTFFTDCKIAPVSFTLDMLEQTFSCADYTMTRSGKTVRYEFAASDVFYTAYLTNEDEDFVHRVEMVSRGRLIRKDYYTYCRIYAEYYAPLDGRAHLYQRRFFNEDGTVAYEESIDGEDVMYRFPDRLLGSKEELVGYLVSRLSLTNKDVVIIDRTTGIGQTILQNAKGAKIGIVIHADHFSEGGTDDVNILWNNHYEYAFSQHRHMAFYVTATEAQRTLLMEQFERYNKTAVPVYTIPVGSLDRLTYPVEERRAHSLITASRLATEKHVDWLIAAVARARREIPDLTLDIYGEGGEQKSLSSQIARLELRDCVRLMGQHNLEKVYMRYDAYLSGSTSEGFGLTLLEAVGSGLPVIGFDVRYGNQTFIENCKNGYRISITDEMDSEEKIRLLAEGIVRLFREADMERFRAHSYNIAKRYLTKEVERRWQKLLQELT